MRKVERFPHKLENGLDFETVATGLRGDVHQPVRVLEPDFPFTQVSGIALIKCWRVAPPASTKRQSEGDCVSALVYEVRALTQRNTALQSTQRLSPRGLKEGAEVVPRDFLRALRGGLAALVGHLRKSSTGI